MQDSKCLDMVQKVGNMSMVLRLGRWHTFNRAPSTIHHDPPSMHSACTNCISTTQEDVVLMLINVRERKLGFLAAHMLSQSADSIPKVQSPQESRLHQMGMPGYRKCGMEPSLNPLQLIICDQCRHNVRRGSSERARQHASTFAPFPGSGYTTANTTS